VLRECVGYRASKSAVHSSALRMMKCRVRF